MNYCFSGTGNSQWVADKLNGLLTNDEDTYGMTFPIYAWGIPKIVKEHIETHLSDIQKAKYVWAVVTCGDDIGHADNILRKSLGGRLDAIWSVHMPNTYVCLPGFDVDPDDVATAKVQETLQRIPSIAESIKNREHKTDVVRGSFAWLKTYILRPLFNRFLVTDKYFHTTKNCIRCKRCVRACPLNNITTDSEGKIIWKHENCTGCLRCYHRCPSIAIQFGWFTKNKGQKIHDFE